MDLEKTHIVSNVGDYLKIINELSIETCFYRGESDNYRSISASAFRATGIGWEGREALPFTKMLNEYKKDVWNRINSNDKKNFLAFAQHHGIPTNLIDITKNPLIALYFASQKDLDKEGYVYIYENDYVDITEVLENMEGHNLLNSFLYDGGYVIRSLTKLINDFALEFPKSFFKLLREVYIDTKYPLEEQDMENINQRSSILKFEDYVEYINRRSTKFMDYILELGMDEDELELFKMLSDDKVDIVISYYMVKVYTLIQKVLKYGIYINNIPYFPRFIYDPILEFNRANNQSGLFLYQTHLSYVEPAYETKVLATQNIDYRDKIIIKNKDEIAKELDRLNINKKFIFNDFDSIADYIRIKNM